MSVFTWCTTVLIVGTEKCVFLDCCTFGLFNRRLSVLGVQMLAFNGMRHIFSTMHRQPFNTDTSDIIILVVRPSYMFTSFPS